LGQIVRETLSQKKKKKSHHKKRAGEVDQGVGPSSNLSTAKKEKKRNTAYMLPLPVTRQPEVKELMKISLANWDR
jgi:hypothetical protein